MKPLKTFILVGLAFLIGAIIAAGLVWYYLIIVPIKTQAQKVEDTAEKVVEEVKEAIPEEVKEVAAEGVEKAKEVSDEIVEDVMAIDLSTLPEAQQKILEKVGIEGPEYIITPGMKLCAEEKLGNERLMEIVDGDTPTFLESSSLVSCIGR